jgi:hypothetical protein
VARQLGGGSTRSPSPELRPQQPVDLGTDLAIRERTEDLEVDEADEQRIERASSRGQLLRDLGEWLTGRDHPRKGVDLATGSLRVPGGGGPGTSVLEVHCDT